MNTLTCTELPDPVSLDPYARGRAMLLRFDTESYAEAVPLLREAIETDPYNALPYAALAETYGHWGFRRELNGDDGQSYYDLCFDNATHSLELKLDVGEGHRAMAVALRRGLRCDPAAWRREAKAALDLNPYNGENCHESWKASGSDPADQGVYKAIALFPSLISAHIDLGVALCERGRLSEAAYHLGRALEINPRNSLAGYDLAMVLLRQERPDEAREVLARVQSLFPDDALLHAGRDILREAAGTAAR